MIDYVCHAEGCMWSGNVQVNGHWYCWARHAEEEQQKALQQAREQGKVVLALQEEGETFLVATFRSASAAHRFWKDYIFGDRISGARVWNYRNMKKIVSDRHETRFHHSTFSI